MAFHAEDGILKTTDKGYNPRIGTKYGRVGKDDFSIDGKSWNYRDPHNQSSKDRQRTGWTGRGQDPGAINENAQDFANPLYDYSYGQARDAAKALGIGNVDSQEETNRIIDYIQNGPKQEEVAPVEEVAQPDATPEEPAEPVMASPEVTQAKDRANAWEASGLGTSGATSPYGRKSAFAERTTDFYKPNQAFDPAQTSVTPGQQQQAQSFLQNRKEQTKRDFNFQPTLK